VNVDAVLFWMVFDPEKAALEVQEYMQAVSWAAQTALRDIIGRTSLADLLHGRERIEEELQKLIDQRSNPWGITVQSVEMRDVVIPVALQDAMSREAQAEREKRARVILGEAEREIAHLFEEASRMYQDNPTALHLRAMNIFNIDSRFPEMASGKPRIFFESRPRTGPRGDTQYSQALSHLEPQGGNDSDKANGNHPVPCYSPSLRFLNSGKQRRPDIHPYILAHCCYRHANSDQLGLSCHFRDCSQKNRSNWAADDSKYNHVHRDHPSGNRKGHRERQGHQDIGYENHYLALP
jgi:hypothetical protein